MAVPKRRSSAAQHGNSVDGKRTGQRNFRIPPRRRAIPSFRQTIIITRHEEIIHHISPDIEKLESGRKKMENFIRLLEVHNFVS